MTSDRARWLLLALAAGVLVVHSLIYNFVTDDAYISFVFSRNLAEHGQLTFNLGHPVEGYTNFSWTALLGLLMLGGIPPEISSRVLGTACALATLYVVFRTMERALGRKTPWAAVPPLLLACSSGFACWTSGGLETQLFTLACALAIDGVVAAEDGDGDRALRRAGFALALGAMTRPEGLLVAAVLGAVRFTCNLVARRSWIARGELGAAAAFLVVWAPWFLWRLWYYGHWFPNTYYVKASGPWTRPEFAGQMRDSGIYYVWSWLTQTRLLYVLPLALLGLVAIRPRTPRFALALSCGLLAAVYVPYAISVGGDFMGLHRFIMPVFVVAAILVVLGLEWLVEWTPAFHPFLPVIVTIAAPIALVVGFAITQVRLTAASVESCAHRICHNDHGIDSPAYLMVYTEDRATIGRAMASCFRPDDFSIVGGAGAQPYLARMAGIDVFGLVSDRIAHEEPRSNPRAGHTKSGSSNLLASYDPTFVFNCYLLHAKPDLPANHPWQCGDAGFWKSKGYEEVTMHIPGLLEQGEYYTFLAKKDRDFQCPGRVK